MISNSDVLTIIRPSDPTLKNGLLWKRDELSWGENNFWSNSQWQKMMVHNRSNILKLNSFKVIIIRMHLKLRNSQNNLCCNEQLSKKY